MLGQASGWIRRRADIEGGMTDGGTEEVAGIECGNRFYLVFVSHPRNIGTEMV